MGMFDYVNVVDVDCPTCNHKVGGWQSKDSSCYLECIDPDYVNVFYSYCNNCRACLTYEREPIVLRTNREDNPFTIEEVENLGFKLRVRVG
jgi:hypothetical protein